MLRSRRSLVTVALAMTIPADCWFLRTDPGLAEQADLQRFWQSTADPRGGSTVPQQRIEELLPLAAFAGADHPEEAALQADHLDNDEGTGEVFGLNRAMPASDTALAGADLTG